MGKGFHLSRSGMESKLPRQTHCSVPKHKVQRQKGTDKGGKSSPSPPSRLPALSRNPENFARLKPSRFQPEGANIQGLRDRPLPVFPSARDTSGNRPRRNPNRALYSDRENRRKYPRPICPPISIRDLLQNSQCDRSARLPRKTIPSFWEEGENRQTRELIKGELKKPPTPRESSRPPVGVPFKKALRQHFIARPGRGVIVS